MAGLCLTIEYPENLPVPLRTTRKDFEHEASMAMAVKLQELKRWSSGVAAALAGWIGFLSCWAFNVWNPRDGYARR